MRKIYRAESGSVIEIDYWGKPLRLFVADAKFRASLIFNSGDATPNLPKFILPTKTLGNLSDKQLQNALKSLSKDGLARDNTDALVWCGTYEAARYCRSLELDMPNIFELIVIYQEADSLDALDPTVSDYDLYALGSTNPRGKFGTNGAAWSSTLFSTKHSWCMTYRECLAQTPQWYCRTVIPVKEF